MINGLATHLSAWKQKDLADFRNKLQNCVPKRNEDSKINRIYWDEMHHKSSLQVSEEKLGFLTVLSIASKSIKRINVSFNLNDNLSGLFARVIFEYLFIKEKKKRKNKQSKMNEDRKKRKYFRLIFFINFKS